jgi:hypothetical protein
MNVTDEEKIVIKRAGKIIELYPVYFPDGRGGQVGPLLSYKDVTIYTGLSINTVRIRLRRAGVPVYHSPGGKANYVLLSDLDRVFAVHPLSAGEVGDEESEDTEDE